MKPTLNNLKKDLQQAGNKEKAGIYQRFFKTAKGQYGEGDIFLGITVPVQRKIAKQYKGIALSDVEKLLQSKIHEHRFTALEILVLKYEKGEVQDKKKITSFYLKNKKYINNWDLVDTSAPYIPGDYFFDKPRDILIKLAHSKSMWDKRIAIISTFGFIRKGDYTDTLNISEILLQDTHDLIHKAVGWMLREVGNRSLITEERFLKKHYKKMPRTMLRYAIEKFPPEIRKAYLSGMF